MKFVKTVSKILFFLSLILLLCVEIGRLRLGLKNLVISELKFNSVLRIVYWKQREIEPQAQDFQFRSLEAIEDNDKGIHLIIPFFQGNYSTESTKEVVRTLSWNLQNQFVTRIHLLVEDHNPIECLEKLNHTKPFLSKIVPIPFKAQASYKDLFLYGNTILRRGSIAIVANADIKFDKSLACLAGVNQNNTEEKFNSSKRLVLALSRQPGKCETRNFCNKYIGSHDAFVYAPPISEEVIRNLDFYQNSGYHTENIVIWEMRKAGYSLENPCRDIRITHHHCVRERRYKSKRSVAIGKTRLPRSLRNGTIKFQDRHSSVFPSYNSITCPKLIY